MKYSKKTLLIAFSGLLLLSACSKKNDVGPGGDGHTSNYGTGTLYYEFATDGILKFDLKTGVKATLLPSDNGRYGWDISQDGKKILQSSDAPDQDYDANLYTISNISDGTIVARFKYYPAEGDYTSPYLSPDGSLIAVDPTYDDGIVILDLQGHVLHNLKSYQGKDIKSHTVWMPDNTLIFAIDNTIYRTNQAFTTATVVKQLNFQSWGDLTVSKDGSKFALVGGNHIWIMNEDGTGLVQVTESDVIEAEPVFSPDNKFLSIGTNYRTTGPFGHIWNLAIIPADGQKYNVNKNADKRVIPIIANGETATETGDGNMLWR